jgi:hypothetical protein
MPRNVRDQDVFVRSMRVVAVYPESVEYRNIRRGEAKIKSKPWRFGDARLSVNDNRV